MKHLLPLLLCSFLIGCGGGSSTPDNSPPPVSPAPPPAPISNPDPDLTQGKLLSDAELDTPALSPTPAVTQAYEDWLARNHSPIRSVTYDKDFSDLEFLRAAIDQRTIVQLGESSHGTREFNQIKTRMIKYLHQNMDFNVLAFESGFFEGFYADSIRANATTDRLMGFVFGPWQTNEVYDLFRYVSDTQSGDNPMRLIGFDSQISSRYFEFIEDYITNSADIADFTAADKAALAQWLRNFRTQQAEFSEQGCFQTYGTACRDSVNIMANIKAGLGAFQSRLDGLTDPSLEEKVISIAVFAARGQIDNTTTNFNRGDSSAVRDKNMADIFGKIRRDLYPDEKIIIWAHNRHIAHEQSESRTNGGSGLTISKPMGAHLKETYPDDLFSIGLYMIKGETAGNDRRSIPVVAPVNNSLEALAHSVRKAAFFVDTRPEQTREEGNEFLFEYIDANYWGGSFGSYEMITSDQFDGLIFIDKSSLPSYR